MLQRGLHFPDHRLLCGKPPTRKTCFPLSIWIVYPQGRRSDVPDLGIWRKSWAELMCPGLHSASLWVQRSLCLWGGLCCRSEVKSTANTKPCSPTYLICKEGALLISTACLRSVDSKLRQGEQMLCGTQQINRSFVVLVHRRRCLKYTEKNCI